MVQVPVQSKVIPTTEPEVQLAHELVEEVPLANVDEFLKLVIEEIQDRVLIEEEAQFEEPVLEKYDHVKFFESTIQEPIQPVEPSIPYVVVPKTFFMSE